MRIRPEAQPANWDVLDGVQRQAIKHLTQMLSEAMKGLPLASERGKSLSRDTQFEKKSRTAFLSGDRGTGKTTVLQSLKRFTEHKASGMDGERGLAIALEDLRDRVVWLDELDMEPIKHAASLLMAIFARIEAAFLNLNGHTSGDGSERSEAHGAFFSGVFTGGADALMRFKRLQCDVAVGWDSNIRDRKGHLDADSYAVELMREEKARLSLGRDLDHVLEDLAQKGFARTAKRSPLFILPVDDLDLNPQFCLHLLRLLRLISTPRLFFIVLGDETLAELVVNLQINNDFATLAGGNSELISSFKSELTQRAGNVSANALRKLLPPAQRVHLGPMTLLEALDFRPLLPPIAEGRETLRLHQLLAKLRIDSPDPSEVCDLRAFLFGSEAVSQMEARENATLPNRPSSQFFAGGDEGPLGNAFYSGRFLLKAPPRRLADLWLELNEIVSEKQNADCIEDRLIDTFALKCRNSLVGDSSIGPSERREIKLGIEKNDSGRWQIRSLPIRLISETIPSFELAVDFPTQLLRLLQEEESESAKPLLSEAVEEALDQVTSIHELRFEFSSAERWRFEIAGDRKSSYVHSEVSGSESQRELELETASELTIFHDLLALRTRSSESSSLLGSLTGAEAWAATVWSYDGQEPVKFPWPIPRCTSIWELDWFRKHWNDTVQRVRNQDLNSSSKVKDQDTVTILASAWIVLGTSIILGSFEVPRFSALDNLRLARKLLEQLASQTNRHDSTSRAAQWICSVYSLLMPEMGVSLLFRRSTAQSIAIRIIESEVVSQVIRRFRFMLQRKRAERFSKFLAADSARLYQVFEEYTAKKDEHAFLPPTALVYRLAGLSVPRRRRKNPEL